MARQTRLEIAGEVHLISLRGNNSQAIFFADADYADFLQFAADGLPHTRLQVHSFCLLPQAAYLLVTPLEAGTLSPWVQQVARRFVRTINQRHARSGTLFEGRFRSGVLQADAYLLPCMWALDALPVAQGLAKTPADYKHSSAAWFAGLPAAHAGWQGNLLRNLLTPHPLVWQLGNTPFEREAVYARELEKHVSSSPAWLATLQAGWALGDAAYLAELERKGTRRVQQAKRGRPRKAV